MTDSRSEALATFHREVAPRLNAVMRQLQQKDQTVGYATVERFEYLTCGTHCFWVTVELKMERKPWQVRATFDPPDGSQREIWRRQWPLSESDWNEMLEKATLVFERVR